MHVKKLSLLVTVLALSFGAIAPEAAKAESEIESLFEESLFEESLFESFQAESEVELPFESIQVKTEVEAILTAFNDPVLLSQGTPPRAPRIRGIVKSVVGTQVLVELDRAQDPFLWVGVPQAQLGVLNLMGGTPVYVEGNKIVGLAPHNVVSSRPSNFSSRIQALWADYERSIQQRPDPDTVSLPNFEPTPVSPAAPSPEPVPIPGLW